MKPSSDCRVQVVAGWIGTPPAAWDKIAEAKKVAARIANAVLLPRARLCLRFGAVHDCANAGDGWRRRKESRIPTGSRSIVIRP